MNLQNLVEGHLPTRLLRAVVRSPGSASVVVTNAGYRLLVTAVLTTDANMLHQQRRSSADLSRLDRFVLGHLRRHSSRVLHTPIRSRFWKLLFGRPTAWAQRRKLQRIALAQAGL